MDLPIRKELFWDINVEALDPQYHKRIIIEWVFMLGTLQEFRTIMQHYGKDIIREEIMKVGYLDPKSINFAVAFLKIPKNHLKCYLLKQSRPFF